MAATKRRRGAGKATAAGPKKKRAKGALEGKESEEAEKGPPSVEGQDEFHIPPPVSQVWMPRRGLLEGEMPLSPFLSEVEPESFLSG